MFYLTSGSSEKILVLKEKLRQFCQYCILNVVELFEEIFIKNNFFSNEFGFWGKMSGTTSEKFPAELSKLFSTCPVHHFENEYHIFWNFRKFSNFER